MIRHVLLIGLVGAALLLVTQEAAASDDSGCTTQVEIGQAGAKCVKSGTDTNAYIAGHSDHTYSIRPACEVGGLGLCAEPATCTIGGHDGYLYNVYQDADPDPLDWQACLTRQEASPLVGRRPRNGQRAFRRQDWPPSGLGMPPPERQTPVNFSTYCCTTHADA